MIAGCPTPLIRLARLAPDWPFYLAAGHLQPTGSIYDRIAGPIFAAHDAELGPGATAVAGGGGSACLAFAAHAARRSCALVVVCPASTLPEHRKLLEGHRVTVVLSDPARGMRGVHEQALEESRRRGGVLLYSPATGAEAEDAFARTVGAELAGLFTQVAPAGARAAVVAPVASGALLRGVARAVQQAGHHAAFAGTFTPAGARATKQDGVAALDEAPPLGAGGRVAVTDRQAYEARCALARKEGILLGMGSAAAVHAALARDPDEVQIAVAVDAGDRYFSVDHHFRALDAEAAT